MYVFWIIERPQNAYVSHIIGGKIYGNSIFCEIISLCCWGALDEISEWEDSTAIFANILAKSMVSKCFMSLKVIKVTIIY